MPRPIPLLLKILPLLILLAGIGGFLALRASRPPQQIVPSRERVWRVAVMPAAPAEHRPVLALFGQVEAPDRVRIAAPVAGRLLELRVRDGERVAAGTLLARLDPRDLEPRLARARAEVQRERLRLTHDTEALAQERELLRLAELAVTRAETVQTRQLGSVSSVDEARQQQARARLAVTLREQSIAEHPARLAALQASLAEAERDAERGTLQAPFAARIGPVEAAAGDQLQPNQTVLTLYPPDGLYVRARIPGAYGVELRQALAGGARLTATGEHAGQPVTAVLERLAGAADVRGIDALLRLAPDTDLPLGAFVDMRLERPAAPATLALPFSALHGGDRIFAVIDGRLRGFPIARVGEPAAAPGQLLVRAPELAPGTPVMITHLPHAVDSLKVEILP